MLRRRAILAEVAVLAALLAFAPSAGGDDLAGLLDEPADEAPTVTEEPEPEPKPDEPAPAPEPAPEPEPVPDPVEEMVGDEPVEPVGTVDEAIYGGDL